MLPVGVQSLRFAEAAATARFSLWGRAGVVAWLCYQRIGLHLSPAAGFEAACGFLAADWDWQLL